MVIARAIPNVAIERLGDCFPAPNLALSCRRLAINNSVINSLFRFSSHFYILHTKLMKIVGQFFKWQAFLHGDVAHFCTINCNFANH